MIGINIVIPSHKRAANVLTTKVVQHGILCVPDSQYLEYKKYNPTTEIVAHPDTIIGLPPKLEWIRQNFDNCFFLDDDCTGFKQLYEKANPQIKDKDLVREIIENTAYSARMAGSYLFGFAKDPNPLTYNAHEPIKLTGFVLGGATGLLSGSKLYWDCNMKINGDYFISLLNAFYHRTVYKDMRYCFTFAKTFTNQGGLAGVRNTALLEEHYHYLRSKFGDAIQLKGNSNPVRKNKSQFEMSMNLPF